MEEEKKTKGSKVGIIILILIILGMGGYISYDKYFYKYFKKSEVKETKKEENTKEEKVNGLEKDSITKLVNILTNNTFYYGDDTKSNSYINEHQMYLGSGPLFNTSKRVTNNEVPDEYKLFSILENADIKDFVDDYTTEEIAYLKEEVDNIYKKIYGNKPKNGITLKNTCPGYLEIVQIESSYGEDAPYYKTHGGCGDTGIDETKTYLYNITKKGKEYYAYVAVGYINFTDIRNNNNELANDDELAKFYTNLEKDKYSGNVKEYSDFKIDENNYKEFSKYKITFKEDSNGNYIFKDSVRIEK